MVVFPPPDGPTSASFFPALIFMLTFLSTSISPLYENDTFLNAMSPFTFLSGLAPLTSAISGSVSIISINLAKPDIPMVYVSANMASFLIGETKEVTYSENVSRATISRLLLIIRIPPNPSTTTFSMLVNSSMPPMNTPIAL